MDCSIVSAIASIFSEFLVFLLIKIKPPFVLVYNRSNNYIYVLDIWDINMLIKDISKINISTPNMKYYLYRNRLKFALFEVFKTNYFCKNTFIIFIIQEIFLSCINKY